MDILKQMMSHICPSNFDMNEATNKKLIWIGINDIDQENMYVFNLYILIIVCVQETYVMDIALATLHLPLMLT